MTRMIVAAFAFALATPLASPAQSLRDDPRVASALNLMDLWVDAQLAYERIPGISIGIVHDQELIWSKGYGYADVERQTLARPNTIYSICSKNGERRILKWLGLVVKDCLPTSS